MLIILKEENMKTKVNNIILRPYQNKAFHKMRDKYRSNIKRQLVVMATGTGKRYCAVKLSQIKSFKNTLFIAHREELIDQAREEFDNYFPGETGIIKRDEEDWDKKFVVASIQTLIKRFDKVSKKHFDLIHIDEAHHYASNTWCKPLNYYSPKLLVGWTATPTRLDGLSLKSIFDQIVYNYSIKDGIREGYLCDIEAIQIRTRNDISNIKKIAGDFNQKELSDIVDEDARNELIVESHKKYCGGRQAIVNCVDIRHAIRVNTVFRRAGYVSNVLVSDKEVTPNRMQLIKDFKNKKLQILTNVDILSEGFDYSDIAAIHMARPTQSKSLYIQQIGRGTRKKSKEISYKFGQKVIILDYVDNCGKHKLINTWSLKGTIVDNKSKITLDAKTLKEEKEKEKRIIRIKSRHIIDRKVNLFPIPVPPKIKSIKMREPATKSQLDWLKKEGVYIEGNTYTKGQAHEYINNFPATDKQIYALAYIGYDVSTSLTRGEAEAAFREHDKRKKLQEKEKKEKSKPFKI